MRKKGILWVKSWTLSTHLTGLVALLRRPIGKIAGRRPGHPKCFPFMWYPSCFVQCKGVSVRILDLPTTMLDARDEITAATIKMVNGVLIDVLGYVAETERNFIRKRQAEGIAVAKAKGKHLGRKPKPLPAAWEADMADLNRCTATSLFKKYNFAPATFYEKVRRWENGEIAVEPDKGDSAVKKTTDQV